MAINSIALDKNTKRPSPGSNPRSVSILGATGSVGCNTLALVASHREHYSVEALTAHRNVTGLAAAARSSGARLAVIGDTSLYSDLKAALADTATEVAAGEQALIEAASRPSDWVMAGIVGAAGLAPTLAAVRRGATVAIANKECLVCAGELMMEEVRRHNATLLPADSEHNAIFQVFDFEQPETVDRIILTASGGPFWKSDLAAMAAAVPDQALAHPNWDMGAKISIDSATMMNKGLEFIEACHLFPVVPEQIEVMIHPQSVVHSMVAYKDGSILAQLGEPDMRIPIAYTLAWPDRIETNSPRLNLAEVGSLEFSEPDHARFPALQQAQQAYAAGGRAPTHLNAANEVAVAAYLSGEIGFLKIADVVATVVEKLPTDGLPDLAAVWDADLEARAAARECIGRLAIND